ncbi:MAG: HEPN domain-containing protein [Planctomycetota bacterium]|nr:HEPN domain-containing protein [Planctomycetota bacterium]
MTADEARALDTRACLARAREDLRAADVDLAASPSLLADAAFHAQQASEKAMKGLLAWHDEPFRKTHDLAVIGLQCVAIDAGLEVQVRAAAPLTQYAWKFRYPGDDAEPTRQEADHALNVARSLVAGVAAALRARGLET